MRIRRTLAEPGDEHVHVRRGSLDLRLEGAVGTVPDPAGHPELLRAPACALAEPDTLHASPDDEVAADVLHCRSIGQGRVPGMSGIVDELARARIGGTFNQYADGPRAILLRRRLASYLDARRDAGLLLVGEAPGYRGARVSGIPFTSERQLTGTGPAEATATIVHRVLGALGIEQEVLLWNVVPTHPGTDASNRPPRASEVRAGVPFVERLAEGRRVIAVGRVAARALSCDAVRHPSRGGASRFARELAEAIAPRRIEAGAATLTRRRSPDRPFCS